MGTRRQARLRQQQANTRTNHSSVEPSPSPGARAVRRIGNARTMPSALAVSAIENATTTPGAPAISRIETAKTTPGALAVSKIGIAKTRPGTRSIDRTGNPTTPDEEMQCLHQASPCVLFRSRTSSRKNGPGTSSLRGPSALPATLSSGQVRQCLTLCPAGMPTHRVVLKIGAPFMLLRTINPSTGLLNGTRCLLIAASQWVLRVETATGPATGQRAFVPRCKLTSTEGELPFVLTRRQFPVAPCFAMTINKAQGQTLDRVGIFLRRPVFSHGQLYVAVSRATSRQNLRFIVIGGGFTVPGGCQGTCTTNTVYQEVLNGSGRRRPRTSRAFRPTF